MTLLELMKLLRKRRMLVIVLPIVCAVLTAGVCWGVLENEYTATVSVYVLENDASGSQNSSSYSDLNAGQMMANDIAALAKSETVKTKTAEALGMDSLAGYEVSVSSSTTTRVIGISITADNPNAAAIVANQMAGTLSTVAQDVMGVQSVNVVDQAKEPTSPSGPQRGLYTLVALLAGLFLAICIVVVLDMVSTRVRTPEEAEELLGVPVIGRIPTIKK